MHQDLPKFNQLELISYLIETFQYAKLTIEKKQVKIKIVKKQVKIKIVSLAAVPCIMLILFSNLHSSET